MPTRFRRVAARVRQSVSAAKELHRYGVAARQRSASGAGLHEGRTRRGLERSRTCPSNDDERDCRAYRNRLGDEQGLVVRDGPNRSSWTPLRAITFEDWTVRGSLLDRGQTCASSSSCSREQPVQPALAARRRASHLWLIQRFLMLLLGFSRGDTARPEEKF
jgi:hypothetical protein